MKFKIKFTIDSNRDKEMIKAFLIFNLRIFNIKEKDIEIDEQK